MKTICSLIVCLFCVQLYSQSVITRRSAGLDNYYYDNDLQQVFNDAVEGDTIIIPGAEFTGNYTINTTSVVVGVGYDPVSSAATGVSFLNGSLTINSANTEIIGLKVQGAITFSNNADGGVLQRCRTESDLNFGSNTENVLITECIVTDPSTNVSVNSVVSISNSDNITFNNCLLEIVTASSGSTGCSFNNCIIFDGLQAVSNATFNCNIFNSGISVGTVSSTENDNTFIDNVLLDATCNDDCFTIDIGGDNVSVNNLFLDPNTVFGGQLPDFPVLGEAYEVLNTSPAFNHCGGSGQTGIYGGPQPFKVGAIPFHPHIASKTIAGSSENDQISVVVGVEAQDD